MVRRGLIGLLTAAACVATFSATGVAALGSSSGTIDRTSKSVQWSGTFLAPASGCVSPQDPTCDHFFLTVDAPDYYEVQVTMATARPMVEYADLEVLRPDGTRAALGDRRWGFERETFNHIGVSGSSTTYEIRISPQGTLVGTTYEAAAELAGPDTFPAGHQRPFESIGECPNRLGNDPVEAVRTQVPFQIASPDDGRVLGLDVYVLLNGISVQRGREIMDGMAGTYREIGIDVTYQFKSVEFLSDDWFWEAHRLTGGSPPHGADLVHSITEGSMGLAEGMVWCIGGIREPTQAYSVSVDIPYEDYRDDRTGALLYQDVSSVVVSHEIGHLLGSGHNYATCADLLSAAGPERRVQPCSTMFFESTGAGTHFSQIEAAIIRDYTARFAQD